MGQDIQPPMHLGADVGGTFTDLVFFDHAGNVEYAKIPNRSEDRAASTLQGLDQIVSTLDLDTRQLQSLLHVHGSTIAVNTLIEKRGARLGLLVTEGFRDLLELGRLANPDPMRYDSRRPRPIVPRADVAAIGGRLDAHGAELTPLDTAQVAAEAERLVTSGVEGIVICFLHSYRNPAHEEAAAAVVAERFPGLPVELSSSLWPQAREFERAITTVINAYVRPAVGSYLGSLTSGLASRGVSVEARVARSNGGSQRASTIELAPVSALLSGPASGVAAAAVSAQRTSSTMRTSVTLDMGGTSTDVGVIQDGRPVLSTGEHVADFPILVPVIAVSSIGAGGGSIVWLDELGTLKIGPRSAGAAPGPACYGNGGTEPTLTDAFLLCGYLRDGQALGGTIRLDRSAAEKAFAPIAEALRCGVREAASGVVSIAGAMLAAELSNVFARRGYDPLQSNLIGYGGAGPLVAALLAQDAFINEVVVPLRPGVLSAEGAAYADIEGDFIRPCYSYLHDVDADDVQAMYTHLRSQASAWLKGEREAQPVTGERHEFSADMRYAGQGYDVTVGLSAETLAAGDVEAMAAAFHEAHQQIYGHCDPAAQVWLKELRGHATGTVPLPRPRTLTRPPGGAPEPPTPIETRTIRLGETDVEAAVYRRDDLVPDADVAGPALLEQKDTTTLVPAGWTVSVQPEGELLLTRIPDASTHAPSAHDSSLGA